MGLGRWGADCRSPRHGRDLQELPQEPALRDHQQALPMHRNLLSASFPCKDPILMSFSLKIDSKWSLGDYYVN